MAVAKQPLLDAVMLLEQFQCLYQTASITPSHLWAPKPTELFAFYYLKTQHLLFISGIQELPFLLSLEYKVLDPYGLNVILAILGGKEILLSFPNHNTYVSKANKFPYRLVISLGNNKKWSYKHHQNQHNKHTWHDPGSYSQGQTVESKRCLIF